MTFQPSIGYRGFRVWSDPGGWWGERLLTLDTYEIQDCTSLRDAQDAVDQLVQEWLLAEPVDDDATPFDHHEET